MAVTLFGERLRALRKQAGLTQQTVATRLNIHRTAYTKYETSGVTPDQQGLIKLAQIFGVTVDYLVGREDEPVAVAQSEDGAIPLSLLEQQLLQTFRQMSPTEQQVLVQQAQRTLRLRRRM